MATHREIAEAAREAANAPNFWWRNRPHGDWGLVHLTSPQSEAIEISNAAVIERRLSALSEEGTNWQVCSFSHWAAGSVEQLAIRITPESVTDGDEDPEDAGDYTPEFALVCQLLWKIERYPLLDEADYYRRLRETREERVCDFLRSNDLDESLWYPVNQALDLPDDESVSEAELLVALNSLGIYTEEQAVERAQAREAEKQATTDRIVELQRLFTYYLSLGFDPETAEAKAQTALDRGGFR